MDLVDHLVQGVVLVEVVNIKKIKINIPIEIKNLIQKFDIEANSRKEIIEYVLLNNINITNEHFQQYQQDYEKRLYEFNIAKQELVNKYILPKLKENTKYNWNLDYTTSILTVEVEE